MVTESIKLRFKSALHLGRGTEELDKSATIYSSDSLKSAIYSVGINWYPEWISNPELYFENFIISSAFPFCGKEYFLPKPGGMKFEFNHGDELSESKKAKKISFISSEIFSKWVKDPNAPLSIGHDQIGDTSYLFNSDKSEKFIYTSIQQRVAIPIDADEPRTFYFERLFFKENSGLYFLVQFRNEEIKPKILHILNILGTIGIGSDRTVDNGQFEADPPAIFNLPGGDAQGIQMSLGLYLPTKDEISFIDLENSYYNLVRRGGYIAASENEEIRRFRKNNIHLFGEGSSFKSGVQLKGKVVDLKPPINVSTMHPVWRCGMPIFINL